MNWIHGIDKPWRRGLALAMLATALPVLAQDASLLRYEGPDRAQKVLAAAKAEGTLTLYTSLAAENLKALISPFEERYGIKVTVWRAPTEKVMQRTLTEASGGRHQVDAIHFGSPQLEALYREKLLQPVKSPVMGELIAGSVPAHREWAATILQVYVQAYNTNLIKKEDLPKTYQDLLDPKWKGKFGIESEAWPWYATLVQAMGEDKGSKLFRDVVAANGMTAHSSVSLLNNLVAAGDIAMALTVYQHMPQAGKAKGMPIDWFTLKPVIGRSNGIGIARNAPHPNAALLFHDYMLSASGAQQAFASMGYVATNSKVASTLPSDLRIEQVDPVLVLDQADKWSRSFEDTFVKRVAR